MRIKLIDGIPYKSLLEDSSSTEIRVAIMGVGGTGSKVLEYCLCCNYINTRKLYLVDTDLNEIVKSRTPLRIQLGENLLNGLSTNGDQTVAKQAVKEVYDRFVEELTSLDLLIIYAGLGGGTGSGATPEIIKIAKELGVYCICITSTPCYFEVSKKEIINSINDIVENADTSIVIYINKLLEHELFKSFEKDNCEIIYEMIYNIIRSIENKIVYETIDNETKQKYLQKTNSINFKKLMNELINEDDPFYIDYPGLEINV